MNKIVYFSNITVSYKELLISYHNGKNLHQEDFFHPLQVKFYIFTTLNTIFTYFQFFFRIKFQT